MTGMIGRITIAFLVIGLLGSGAMGQSSLLWQPLIPGPAGDWYGANWIPNILPLEPLTTPSSDDELIVRMGNTDTPLGATVDGDLNIGIARIWIDMMTISNFGGALYVGDSGKGVLDIWMGGMLSNVDAYLGSQSGSVGYANVEGGMWMNSGSLIVGESGTGRLLITFGGRVNNAYARIGLNLGSTGNLVGVDGFSSVWSINSELHVGYEGSGDLVIIDEGVVDNTHGYIGYQSSSTGNVVTVDGFGSTWDNVGDLSVGYEGSGTLNIANNGLVKSVDGYIGYQSDLNTVTVDTGGVWDNSGEFYVGYGGSGSLEINAGSKVTNGEGYIGHESTSIGNVVTVDGLGGKWTSSDSLYVGYGGSGKLSITGGGVVESAYGYIGMESSSTGNVVTVDGTDGLFASTWSNSGGLVVGVGGSGTLNISDDGLVSNTIGYIGNQSTSSGSIVTVGSGGEWSNTGNLYVGYRGSGDLNINAGGMVRNLAAYIGRESLSSGNVVTVDGGGWESAGDMHVGYEGGGTLNITAGGWVMNSAGYIGYASSSTGNVVTVNSGGGWGNSGDLYVGLEGSGTLNITDGGLVSNTHGLIGYASSSTGNVVTVDGLGSTWDNLGDVCVGYEGSGTLNIANNGLVNSIEGCIGYQSGSNTVTVDTGGVWENIGWFNVGYYGSGVLEIKAGAKVTSGDGYIGRESTSIGNVVTVDGTDGTGLIASTWDNSTNLHVGYGGVGALNITDGGVVENVDGYIGYASSSIGNVATVDGADSTWVSSGDLHVGYEGSGTLNITNGGLVENVAGYIGYEYTSIDSIVTVDGTDGVGTSSRWINSDPLYVGYFGSGTLEVIFHGLVMSSEGYIGYENDSSDNIVTVGGSGTWYNTGEFYVGYAGSGVLNIEVGGSVENTNGYIGHNVVSTGNVVTVDDGAWDNSGDLHVGYGGEGELNITNGGSVTNINGYIGYENTSNGNLVTVDTGGTWDNSDDLYVGYGGSGTLNITGGGSVTNHYGYIGHENTSIGNVVTVDGSESMWDNSGFIYVGYGGSGTLNITGGGSVESNESFIGHESTSIGNVVTVDGTNSTWYNGGQLVIGYEGSGTLNITGGGQVTTHYYPVIGSFASSTGNVVTVSGAGSMWVNEWSSMTIGDAGSGTLNISDGGVVVSPYIYIGTGIDSTGTVVTVDGTNSRLDSRGTLDVGRSGTATLNITGGGLVTSSRVYIGLSNTSNGNIVTVDGFGSMWDNSGGFWVGRGGSGTLSITDGGRVENVDGRIGDEATSTGNVVTVDGVNSKWDNSGDLFVGVLGGGVLNIQSGGEVFVGGELTIGSDGVVNVFGGTIRFAREDPMAAGSEDMDFFFGTLAFECDVMVTDSGLVSEIFGSSPTISVLNGLEITGRAALLTPVTLNGGTLSVGSLVNAPFLQFDSGAFNLTDADLSISTGGLFGRTLEVTSDQSISVTNDATVALTGLLLINGGTFSASTTTNQGEIRLTSAPSGSPGLLAGGTVNNEGFLSGNGRISAELHNAATGQVRVASGEQLMLTGAANVNHGTIVNSGGTLQATGPLSNEPGGNIITDGHATLSLTGGLDNSGTVAFSDADAYLYGDVTNNGGALVGLADASTVRFVGSFINSGDVYVGSDSRAVFFGPVSGAGAFPGGGTIEFIDGFSPGESPAPIAFGGDVVFSNSALLQMELGGTSVGGEYDQLEVAGELHLDGTLQVSLIDGFTPSVDDEFDILDFGVEDLVGEFDAIELPELVGRKAWRTLDLYSTGVISVIGMLAGDTNLDWRVDASDYGAFVSALGGKGDRYTDFNEDGFVDLADFAIIRSHFGDIAVSPLIGAAAPMATPEPATLTLFALGGLAVLRRRRPAPLRTRH